MCIALKMQSVQSNWKGGRISKRARCVLADNASPMTYTGTNTWILSEVNSCQAYLVDPGPNSERHLKAIHDACKQDKLQIEAILLTHAHIDHRAGAEALSETTGAKIYARMLGNLDDGLFHLGAKMPKLEVISFPGHSADSVGFWFKRDRSIISGDLIFAQSPTVIVLPDGNLRQYLESLEKLLLLVKQQGIKRLMSAHGHPVENPQSHINATKDHRFMRLEQVRGAVLESGRFDLESILETIYDDIDTRLNPAARMSIQAQIDYLKETNDQAIYYLKD